MPYLQLVYIKTALAGKCKGRSGFLSCRVRPGEASALTLQEQIKETINDGNHRKAKSNTRLYVKAYIMPTVIVECGYLSNRRK